MISQEWGEDRLCFKEEAFVDLKRNKIYTDKNIRLRSEMSRQHQAAM